MFSMMQDPGLYDPHTNEDQSSRAYAAKIVFVELAKILFLVIVTIAVVRYFLFRPFDVKGASMEPNFYEREYLIIDEISYRLADPTRGDVIVLRHEDDNREYFLKRIVGLPGEKIKVTIQLLHIHFQMRRRLRPVDDHRNLATVGHLDKLLDRIDGSQCIGNVSNRN